MQTILSKAHLLLAVISLFVGTNVLYGQSLERQVIGSSGGSFVNTSADRMLEWTLGEMSMVETFQSTSNYLTQGFHQPEVAIVGDIDSDFFEELVVFPNPASDVLKIRYQLSAAGQLSFRLTDVRGIEVQSEQAIEYYSGQQITPLYLHKLSNGMYVLEVTFVSADQEVTHHSFHKINVIQ